MAKTSKDRNFEAVIRAAQKWTNRCLVEDGSIFSEKRLWNSTVLAEVRQAFVDNPDAGDRTFIEKLRAQMGSTRREAKQVMAEMLWILLLFPSNIRTETKKQQIEALWALSGEEIPDREPLADTVLNGIGSGGPGFNNHRWCELVFLISISEEIKKLSSADRKEILGSYDRFVKWIDHVPQNGHRQFRQMLRFFLFPDRVERMSSNRERRAVLEAFGVAAKKAIRQWDDRELDDALLKLRNDLQSTYPNEILDFYDPPLRDRWKSEDSDVNPGIRFFKRECLLFDKYRDSVSWKDVPEAEQHIFKEVREKLKNLSSALASSNEMQIDLRDDTSHPVPNGRSPKEIWSCVYHTQIQNKSYGLQVALIISPRGGEICFCLGAGTSQISDPAKKRTLEEAFSRAQERLASIPDETIQSVESSLSGDWHYRESWRATPDQSEFQSFADWLQYAASPNGNSASVSKYLSPAALEAAGTGVFEILSNALDVFGPVFEIVYDSRIPPRSELRPFDSGALTAGYDSLRAAHVYLNKPFLTRIAASLLAKPFLILTGNSGTGKTKLAELFVRWLSQNNDARFEIVPVGADWSDNRNVLGFVNFLRSTTASGSEQETPIYQSTPILDLIIEASKPENYDIPFFLILDEMNLSHVERYFADFLSTMESTSGRFFLHREGFPLPRMNSDQDMVPPSLAFPDNLFIIGTVNVDETTYMFSPKVLDRANVVEFRLANDQPLKFLESEVHRISAVPNSETGIAEGFLDLSRQARGFRGKELTYAKKLDDLAHEERTALEKCHETIDDIFQIMYMRHFEFAFRSMAEMVRFVAVHSEITPASDWKWEDAMDAQILQKILPKLHGSRRKIGPLLCALAEYCRTGNLQKAREHINDVRQIAGEVPQPSSPAQFPLSHAKLCEMIETVERDQFVSFIQ